MNTLRLHIVVIAMLLCAFSVQSHAQISVDSDGYVFRLPAPWSLLNRDGPEGFDNHNFHNEKGEVVQIGVSRKLNGPTYTRAKRNLRAGVKEDKSQHGWTLVQGRSLNELPVGEFDESIYLDKSSELVSFSYNVYGPDRIAIFTITFNGVNVDRFPEARRLVTGLNWK